ncbi:hypothetical protein SAMN05445060_2540 [Williamsia sterculiae]|uniref:Uncharacterized protein n=1 Tax=Williamsia sterculiae TaxID=1344003 RepID=A0A1N7G6C6_9NOCA|nr:hypothetical protein SAMN05445060_2540 [Williamsia sterculiae]
MLVSGCGAEYVDPPPETPVRLQTPACTGNTPPPPMRVPADFTPVEALVCGEKLVGSPRQRPGPYLYTRYRGDFADALTGFARRDRKRNPNCQASVIALPELWLIDQTGGGFIPRYPMDECGTDNIKALNEILALTVVERERRPFPG